MNTRIGLYVSSDKLLDKVDKVKKTLSDIDDFFLFTDEFILETKEAIFSSFYMRFFPGTVAFLSLDDYLTFKDQLVTTQKILFISTNDLFADNIDRSMLNDVTLKELPCTTT